MIDSETEQNELREKAACAEKFLELTTCPGGRIVVAYAPKCPHCSIATAPSSSMAVCDNPRPDVLEKLKK